MPLACTKNFSLCPVQANFNSFLLTPNAHPDGSAFLSSCNGQLRPLTSSIFIGRIRNCLTLARVNPDDISNHNKRGSATFSYAKGLPADSITLLGDWRSNCYQSYIDDDYKVLA